MLIILLGNIIYHDNTHGLSPKGMWWFEVHACCIIVSISEFVIQSVSWSQADAIL